MIKKELSDSLLAVHSYFVESLNTILTCGSAEIAKAPSLYLYEGVANMPRTNDSPLTCTSAPLTCFSLSYSASHFWKTRQSDMGLVGMLTQRRSCVSPQRSTGTFFGRPFAGTSSSVPRPWWHSEHLIYMSRLPGTNSFLGARAISSCTALFGNEIFFKCKMVIKCNRRNQKLLTKYVHLRDCNTLFLANLGKGKNYRLGESIKV